MAKQLDWRALRPADLPPFMVSAWRSCLNWSLGNKEIVEAFRKQTGNQWRPGSSPMELLIDEATGANVSFFEAYIPWFNRHVWSKGAR